MPGKTLMILGAGAFQVAAIRKAAALGHRVVTVDYTPANIGHRYSHASVDASTTDPGAVLAAARAHEIDGIVTMASDVALPSVVHVAEALGLPGPPRELVEVATRKNRFRPLQERLGLGGPAFVEVEDFDRAIRSWPGGPAVVKPAVSSGSRGVVRLDVVDAGALPHFQRARELSFDGCVCLEELIEGDDVTAEGFVLEGAIAHLSVTRKHVEGFSVIGHELPAALDPNLRRQIHGQLQAVFDETGYQAGPFDADFRIADRGAVLLEMSPRLGGNAVPLLVEAVTGVPLVELAIRHALGEPLAVAQARREAPPHAAVLLRSERSGTVRALASERAIRAQLPPLADWCLNLAVGDRVERFEHGGHVFGYCVVDMGEGTGFDAMLGRVLGAMEMAL